MEEKTIKEKKMKDLNRQLEFQVDELMEQLEKSDQARKDVKHELQLANDKIIQLEEELYESKTIQKELLDQLKEIEDSVEDSFNEVARLKAMNAQMKNMVYVPKETDQTDRRLGAYINNFPNKFPEKGRMKIMFLRESEGVYRFGQKRVYIKVEKGDQILVRVGGGFMHIDDFITQYTPNEVEKIERKDVLGRFVNKQAIQNFAAHNAMEAYESSPIRSPQRARSPDKSRFNSEKKKGTK